MPNFGENLRALRKARGYSQQKFANVIDSTQSAVTTWERNERMPSLSTIQHIADTFKVPLSSLISIEDTGHTDDFVREVADILQKNVKLRVLLNKAKYLSDENLDTIISVINAIVGETDK